MTAEVVAPAPASDRGLAAEDVRRLEQELHDVYAELRKAEDQLNTLMNGSYRLGRLIAATSVKGAPRGTARRRALSSMLAVAREARADPRLLLSRGPRLNQTDLRWNRFCKRHDPSAARLREMRAVAGTWDRPLVSILMPTYEPNARFLRAAIDSVVAQAYESWELCIVDDGSRSDTAAKTAAEFSRDSRVRFARQPVNQGIAAATQAAADMSTGELIALLDHDDVLQPHAIFEMVSHLRAHPECELVYSDEDKLDPWGRRIAAHLKPDWSPELMDSCNYMCHFTVIRRELFERAGGFRAGFDGSQDFDLFLRCSELAKAIGHVREVLYSWRINVGSAAGSTTAKPASYGANVRILEERLARSGEQGTVEESALKGACHLRRAITGTPVIGVIIPTRDAVDLLRLSVACVERRIDGARRATCDRRQRQPGPGDARLPRAFWASGRARARRLQLLAHRQHRRRRRRPRGSRPPPEQRRRAGAPGMVGCSGRAQPAAGDRGSRRQAAPRGRHPTARGDLGGHARGARGQSRSFELLRHGAGHPRCVGRDRRVPHGQAITLGRDGRVRRVTGRGAQ